MTAKNLERVCRGRPAARVSAGGTALSENGASGESPLAPPSIRSDLDQRTFCTSPPIPSVTRSPSEAAESTTAPAARRTRVTALLLPPSEPPPDEDDDARLREPRLVEDFFADDFRAVDLRADDVRAEDFFADARFTPPRFALDFFAVERFADDFFAVERFAEDFFAVERLADDFFAVERFAEDFFADDFRPDDFRAPPVFEVAEAPDVRVLRRAVPLFRREDLPVDVLPEDFERVAIGVAPVLRRCAPRVRKN
jgi:hypothetical protein